LESYFDTLSEKNGKLCRLLMEEVKRTAVLEYSNNHLCAEDVMIDLCFPFLTAGATNDEDKIEELHELVEIAESADPDREDKHDRPVNHLIQACLVRLIAHEDSFNELTLRGLPPSAIRHSLWDPPASQAEALEKYTTGKGMLFYFHVTNVAGKLVYSLAEESKLKIPSEHVWDTGSKAVDQAAALLHKFDFVSMDRPMPHPAHKFDMDALLKTKDMVLVTMWRHPISRIMGRHAKAVAEYPEAFASPPDFERYQFAPECDNYALRWITGKRTGIVNRQDLELAKERLRYFSVVMIFEWLQESTQMLCHVLQWKHCNPEAHHAIDKSKMGEHSLPFNERIPNATQLANIYDLNALDIALYDFAVELNVRQMSKYQLTLPEWEKYALPAHYYENKCSSRGCTGDISFANP
jgi:hypothetical protein